MLIEKCEKFQKCWQRRTSLAKHDDLPWISWLFTKRWWNSQTNMTNYLLSYENRMVVLPWKHCGSRWSHVQTKQWNFGVHSGLFMGYETKSYWLSCHCLLKMTSYLSSTSLWVYSFTTKKVGKNKTVIQTRINSHRDVPFDYRIQNIVIHIDTYRSISQSPPNHDPPNHPI